mmetsp:Transcript_24967/g.36831  ORF Transcript_24967/g.36831 Transcript_24967/m.36831 type:complete len:197 (-) Transcript_24967:162-752(-)
MDLYCTKLKLEIVKFCSSIRSSNEVILSSLIGEEFEWCAYEAFVSGLASLKLCEVKYAACREHANQLERDIDNLIRENIGLNKYIRDSEFRSTNVAIANRQLAQSRKLLEEEILAHASAVQLLETNEAKITELRQKCHLIETLESQLAEAKGRISVLEAEILRRKSNRLSDCSVTNFASKENLTKVSASQGVCDTL